MGVATHVESEVLGWGEKLWREHILAVGTRCGGGSIQCQLLNNVVYLFSSEVHSLFSYFYCNGLCVILWTSFWWCVRVCMCVCLCIHIAMGGKFCWQCTTHYEYLYDNHRRGWALYNDIHSTLRVISIPVPHCGILGPCECITCFI